uniref:Uncharacterized protein n=1 Tax=Timema poppense TaxID=170557 RepID=A0A7R9DVE2_TIMPO|nr:unnamed protein product [Timema poppensis]
MRGSPAVSLGQNNRPDCNDTYI